MSLAEILSQLAPDMKRVEYELSRMTAEVGGASGSRDGILSRITSHPFNVPGKRIRPALVLIASRAAGAPRLTLTHIRLAAAVELLHAASLVHDDVIDGADMRRHQVSLNRKYGNRIAVLGGDILYTAFFSQIIGLEGVSAETRISLMSLFLETTRIMCLGEILAQEAGRGDSSLSYADYLEIAKDKTAVLFSACCRSAALVSGADPAAADDLAELGMGFGTLFQIADDLMDNDHCLDPSEDLEAKAAEFRVRTLVLIDRLRAGEHGVMLRGLVDYVTRATA